MKKFLLSVLVSFSGYFVFSQGPTLTSTNSGYTIGQYHTSYNCDTTGIRPGNAGPNQTWDFSGLTITTNAINLNCKAPSTTTHASTFPSATTCFESTTVGGNPATMYYIQNSTELSYLGGVTGVSVYVTTILYTNPQKTFTYPFNYTNTFTDNFSGTITSGVVYDRTGTTTVTADGYGNLIVPGKTYNNVLRVKTTQSATDTCIDYMTGQRYSSVLYCWYDGVHEIPVLSVFFQNLIYNGTNIYYGYVSIADYAIGINDDNVPFNNFTVYPNPVSSDVVHISFNSNIRGNFNITVTDMTGRFVKNMNITGSNAGNSVIELPIAGIDAGIYNIQITQGENHSSKKLVIQ